MEARAGVGATGTEGLTGRVLDRNGPWLSERLGDLGVDHAHTLVVGDRREDMAGALRWLPELGIDVLLTSGGLGPTADDLTAEVVAEAQGRPLELDAALEERIWAIVEPLRTRFRDLDPEALRESTRKQAWVPRGATVLEPVGTAPGLVVPPSDGRGGPTVVVLPGPPRELQPMWTAAMATEAFRAAIPDTVEYRWRIMRLFGIPESEIVATLGALGEAGVDLDRLEVTTCLRRGEIEIATRYEPGADEVYAAFERGVAARHAHTLFSTDGSTVDDQVAAALAGRTIATAESCTGGGLAARLTERAGSSA